MSIHTTAPEDQDDRLEKKFRRELDLKYGENVKIIKLKTKE